MTDIIIHKHSISAGDAPEPAELNLGELAIQAADGHIYLKKTDGTVNRVTMLPGGTQQQVLYKTNAGDYALGWGTITSTLMGGALWSEVVAEVQRVFALVEGTASVLLSAPATLTAGSTGPITVSVADTSYLTDGTSITGVLGTVYGTLSRSGSTYSFESVQSYTSNVTFATGTRFAAAFLNDTFNPLRIGSAEVEDDNSYTDGSGYGHAVVDSAGRIGYGVKTDGTFDVPSGNINLDDAKVQDDDSYTEASGYARVEVDENGRIAWGIKSDGTVAIKKALVEGNSTVQGSSTVEGNGIFESDVTIQGDLTVQGTTVTIDVTDLTIEDNTILLNKGESGSGVTLGSAGIEVDRGTADNVKFEWNEANQAWTAEESIRTNSSLFISGSSSEKDDSYTEGSGYIEVVLDSADRIGYGLKTDGSFAINGGATAKDDESYTNGSGYSQAWVDIDGRVSFGIETSGNVKFNRSIALRDGSTQTYSGEYQELYSHAMLDANERLAFGVTADGAFDINQAIRTKKSSTYDYYIFVETDNDDKISRAILPSGQQYFPKADFGELTIQGQPLSANLDVRSQVSGDSTKGIDYDATTGVFSSPDGHANRIIVKWGDSISADISNSTLLEQLESGRQMLSRSTGGIDNGSILARFGALPITGRVYWEVKTVTVASYTGNTVTLSAGDATDIEVGDYFYGSGQHNDTVITAVDTGTDEITLSIDAGTLVTTAGAYEIQRPKIEAGKQTRIHNLLPTTVHNQTSTGVLFHFHIKNLKGVPYPGSTNLPRDFNRNDSSSSNNWADVIAEHTADGFISTAPRVVVDTTVTSGGTAAGATSIVVADASKIAPGHFIMAKGIPYGCRVWDVDYDTNTVKLAMDTDSAVTGNVRVYERVEFKPDTTADISGVGEVQLKHCINIFDFDEGTIPETFRPHWWPNQHHGPEQFDFSRADHVAQCRAFVDTQNNPYGKYLITSYQIWGNIYEGQSNWDARRDRALWASEAFPENFYDLAREVWVKAESWYQTNYLTLYQANWEKTFIQMGSGAIAGAPTSGTYSGGAALMDGDLWNDGGTLYVLLLTTGDATHDAAQEAMFGGTHTLPTTTGQGIWITLTSYATLAGTGTLYSGWASGRSGVIGGVTYQGSAYDIARKSSPRIGKRDQAHSNAYGSRLLGYLIGQELLRRGW